MVLCTLVMHHLPAAGRRPAIAVILAGAAWHLRGNGFFMNWFGNQKGEGLEFFLLAIGGALALTVLGGGKWSVDARLTARA